MDYYILNFFISYKKLFRYILEVATLRTISATGSFGLKKQYSCFFLMFRINNIFSIHHQYSLLIS